jgi:hypothetical protein
VGVDGGGKNLKMFIFSDASFYTIKLAKTAKK